MSADNWTTCPKCGGHGPDYDRADRLDREAAVAYGTISSEKYLVLLERAREFRESLGDPEQTLRENYELGINDKEFSISYRASCDNCKYEFKFNHEEELSV
jgi:hypothetical protein